MGLFDFWNEDPTPLFRTDSSQNEPLWKNSYLPLETKSYFDKMKKEIIEEIKEEIRNEIRNEMKLQRRF